MFFPHLREKELDESMIRKISLEKNYKSWANTLKYKACISQGNECRLRSSSSQCDDTFKSLELCAGTGVMSQALKKIGFKVATLDM